MFGVYRPNNNRCFDYFQFEGRIRSNKYMIDRKDVKGMLKALAHGELMWYAPDHDYGRRRSTFAPLFAVERRVQQQVRVYLLMPLIALLFRLR